MPSACKVKGAPIQWKALDPTFGRPNGVAVAKRASVRMRRCCSSTSCSRLEGQKLMQKRNRVPASTKVRLEPQRLSLPDDRPGGGIDEAEKWEKLWSELFLKGQAIRREKE